MGSKNRFLAGTSILAAAVLGAGFAAAPAIASQSSCVAADSRPTVRFLDYDSGVANRTVDGGCSINDLIDDERAWANHGGFVAHVTHLARNLVGADVITTEEAAALTETAAHSDVGKTMSYVSLFDGTAESYANWGYVGGRGFALRDDGSMVTTNSPAGGGLGMLWYRAAQFGDFSLRLQFRDERGGDANARSNSGVLVRFPGVDPATTPQCNTTDPAWVAVNCGHEIQINDSPEIGSNDPRKTGSVYGFADLNLAQARPTGKGVWNDLEIRVVGQHYAVIRNGMVINEFDNVPGLPFPGRPTDPGTSGRQYAQGYIGLQNHDGGSVIAFRNVRVRDLG
ncbi:DUF1080 domain-containing protein [Micromonospora sp. NPDC023966]|uniref:3-keto-disaccharide hydrolase n=1 Tax=Micromonospora sp. NPDC023966 TaxID=3154699 RepID=UPI0033E845BB